MFEKEQLIGKSGLYLTQSLFLETCNPSIDTPIMTLKDDDVIHKSTTLPSLHRLYMEVSDPEEYELAIYVFNSWEHWVRVTSSKKIMRFVQRYRDELEVKVRSGAVKAMIKTATQDGSKGTSAAKYIAEKGWNKRKAGAPSKLEVQKELKIQTDIDQELEEDLKRIGIH